MIKLLVTVKIGGSALHTGIPPEFVSDLKRVSSENKTVLVHGGGKEVTDIATKMNKEQKFVTSPGGFRSRYTDKETAEIYTMVISGRVNKRLVLALQSEGVPAVGLSGLDGLLIQAERKKNLIIIDERGRKKIIDGGYTGKISRISTNLLTLMLNNGFLPVLAPVAASEEFEPLNVDGDRAAANVAGSLKADRLVLLTDVGGVRLNEELVTRMTLSEAKDKLKDLGAGMITKMYAAVEALEMGVSEAIISSGLGKLPITSALAREEGTVITP